jgi:Fibrinogen beta and gamma chains, C-terminal globular domain
MARNVTVNVTIPVLNISVPVGLIYQWIVILSRIDTNFPLNQTYQVYQDGFGSATSNFWLGLNRIYYLTNGAVNGGHTYRLRFELRSSRNSK